ALGADPSAHRQPLDCPGAQSTAAASCCGSELQAPSPTKNKTARQPGERTASTFAVASRAAFDRIVMAMPVNAAKSVNLGEFAVPT
ncbi:MAG TPA: hypothetical protein VJR89_38460, partial [Polyangiales bacterium]|nr:hypothetical protein [Polyangiales bacterium]